MYEFKLAVVCCEVSLSQATASNLEPVANLLRPTQPLPLGWCEPLNEVRLRQ